MRITVQALRKKAIPQGQTCVSKAPVKHKSVQREKDLTKLYNNCKKLVAGAPAFVVYPANAKEAQSNCWKCSSAKLRKSKTTAAFVFVDKVQAVLRKKAIPQGQTCVSKAPVKHKSVQGEKDLTKLYNNCRKLVAGAPAFIVYPAVNNADNKVANAAANAKEAQSNCWKCSSAKLRKSTMTAAFVFVNRVALTRRRAVRFSRFSRRKRRFRRI